MAEKMTIEKIMTRGAYEGFTPYMIATLINIELAKRGLEEIRPQMMYNYDKNGIINGVKAQNKGRGYTTVEVNTFVTRFVEMRAKKAASATKVTTPAAPSSFTVEDVEAATEYRSEVEPMLELDEIEA